MKREAPAAARNRQPILDVLRPRLPATGLVLEVASGTGEHAVHFATALPGLVFQPSDPDADARASIDAWAADHANVRPALALDAAASAWPIERADAVLCCNMIHIAPWEAAVGLIAGAGRILAPGGHALLELGIGQANSVQNLFPGLELVRIAPDLGGVPRCLVLRKPQPENTDFLGKPPLIG